MRVAMYYRNSDVRLEEMPTPTLGPGEMLVQVHASGLCGSDVLEWYRIRKAPRVLGHEIAGQIVELGAGVTRYAVGQRVFVSHHVPCNTCKYCLEGHHTVCQTLHTTNFDPGGFAEFVRIPPIQVDRGVFVLPETLTYEDGVFIEPLACVVRGQREAGFRVGQTVLILGSGISGLLHLLVAKAAGAGRVICTDVNDFRLKMAEDLGADATLQAGQDVPAAVRDVNGGYLADQVVVCTGAMAAFQQALAAVERAGTVLTFATTDPGVELPVPINEFWRNGIRLLPSYANSPADARQAIALLESGAVDCRPMITHRLPLADTQAGFALMTAAGASMKIVILPQE